MDQGGNGGKNGKGDIGDKRKGVEDEQERRLSIKTVLCKHFLKKGRCKFGEECRFRNYE